MNSFLIFALLIVLMLTGMPISIALGLTVLSFLFVMTQVPIEAVALKLFTGIESFEIMAIPFFILAGNFLTHGGVARRMIHFATSMIGHWHGGLGLAGVMACALFAAVSGSSPATVVAIGAIIMPAMVRQGFPKRFGAGVIATVFSVVGPKLLGMATTKVFEGYLGRVLGTSTAGIDFAYISNLLSWLLVLYAISASFQYFQQYLMSGIAQRTVYALRRDVEAKFSRLPLKFFDSRTHGEILSRAVNDLDNISSTLQQNLTQLISSILTVIGIVIMMLTISWVLTIVVILTLPLSVTIVATIAKRSQAYFIRQQKALGEMNGHVAEMYSGHTIVTAFGHEARSIETFTQLNATSFDASSIEYGASWGSG